jgi:hypothetical protein
MKAGLLLHFAATSVGALCDDVIRCAAHVSKRSPTVQVFELNNWYSAVFSGNVLTK